MSDRSTPVVRLYKKYNIPFSSFQQDTAIEVLHDLGIEVGPESHKAHLLQYSVGASTHRSIALHCTEPDARRFATHLGIPHTLLERYKQ